MPHTHLLIVGRGGYKSAEQSAETWSVGIRAAIIYGQVDDRGSLPDNISVVDDSVETQEPTYDFRSSFNLRSNLAAWDVEQYMRDKAVPAFSNLFAQTQISQEVSLQSVSVYPIESPTGRASEGRSARATFAPIKYGTATGSMLPLEVARVLSWGTNRPGPKGRGRIYLPGATTTTIDPYGNMSSATRTTLVNNAKNLLEALSSGTGLVATWNVRPIVTGSPYDRYAVINEARVGSVLDAQRRRRAQLTEAYTRAVVSY